jgi:hypothetical protein
VWSPCNDGAKSDVDREGALTWGRGVIGSESSIGRLQVATAGLAVVGKTRSTIDLGRSGLYVGRLWKIRKKILGLYAKTLVVME